MSDIEPMTDEQLEGWAVARFANGMDEVPIYTDALRDFIAARDEQWRAFLADREKRAQAAQGVKLDEIEQYRMQIAGICTAALGYWKESDGVHPAYDTPALRDVARLYAKFDELYKIVNAPTEASKPVQAEAPTVVAHGLEATGVVSHESSNLSHNVEAPTASNERELLEAEFDRRGDNRGQGLHPYWKNAFREGWLARAALATQQEAQPQADPDAAAKVMYAKHPTYRGTMALPWEAAPDLVRQEWREKAARAVPAGGDKEDADWPITWEVSWGNLDDDDECSPCGWRVHNRGGSRNDREWTLLATGNTPAAAIDAARAAQQATGERGC